MKSIWTLIKIQFKSRVALKKEKTTRERIKFGLTVALLLGVFGAFIFLYYLFAGQFIDTINPEANDLSYPFLVFTILFFQAIQTVFLIPSLLKRLDINNERELLLKLPVSHKQIFASKVIVAYILEVLFAVVLLLPILIAFGIASSMHWGFYLYIPLILLFAPALPFFVASLLLYPAMKLVQLMKSRAILTSLGFLIGLIGGMALYIFVMNTIVGHLTAEGNFRLTLNNNVTGIRNTADLFFPQRLFANLVGADAITALWSFFAILGGSALFMALSYFIGSLAYKQSYQDERSGFNAKTTPNSFKQGSPRKATLTKEIKNIFRSSNYTFQLFLVVIITPMIVFFVDRISSATFFESLRIQQQADNAGSVGFGIALFVLMILIPLSASFAASNITREGHNVYHTKLIPQPFRTQILTKFFIVFVPVAVSAIISVGVLMIPHQPDPIAQITVHLGMLDALFLLFVALCMTAGYVALGTYLDIKRPLSNQVGEGELTRSTPNINFVMALGIVIGSAIGILTIFGNFAHLFEHAHGFVRFITSVGLYSQWIFFCFAALFAVGMCALLFVDGPKKYGRLEQ
ncbi:MAG: hypothetical protein FWE31_01950 [Firmicutes bacterium]|nr:hypothetical protein [Bacillota bacterium]